MLVEHGHVWEQVKKYTFYELGIIQRACAKLDLTTQKRKEHDNVMFTWLGTHLDHKGVKKFLAAIEKDIAPKETNGKKEESEQLKNIRKVFNIMGAK